MKTTKSNQGFETVGIVIFIMVLIVIGLVGYIVWGKRINSSDTSITQQIANEDTSTTNTTDSNEGYFVVKEWGLRFKVPTGITDVRYKITGETLAFYAKPKGLNAEYVKNYDQVSNLGFPSLATGVIYRSKESTKDKTGSAVNGKKIGDYYYYSEWSFSSLATGSACLPLYDMANQESQCVEENKAFELVNIGDGSLLNSIELAKLN